MAERITRSNEAQNEEAQPIQHVTTSGSGDIRWEGVPIDVFRFFSVDLHSADTKTLDKLRAITAWAKESAETRGDMLLNLRDLEIQLGQPRGDQTRYDKMWNWISIQTQINELRKKQEGLSG